MRSNYHVFVWHTASGRCVYASFKTMGECNQWAVKAKARIRGKNFTDQALRHEVFRSPLQMRRRMRSEFTWSDRGLGSGILTWLGEKHPGRYPTPDEFMAPFRAGST